MAAVASNSRLDNIERSINVYVQANIEIGLGVKVIYDRAERGNKPIVEPLPVRWVDLQPMPLSAQTIVFRSSTGRRAARTEYLLNINCFEQDDARFEGGATIYTLSTLVDDVRDLFVPDSSIIIRDYNTVGDPAVGALTVVGIPPVTEVPTAADLAVTQVNLSVTFSYVTESID